MDHYQVHYRSCANNYHYFIHIFTKFIRKLITVGDYGHFQNRKFANRTSIKYTNKDLRYLFEGN